MVSKSDVSATAYATRRSKRKLEETEEEVVPEVEEQKEDSSASESEAEGNSMDEMDNEADESTGKFFASTLQNLVKAPTESDTTVLVKRKTRELKEINKANQEAKLQKKLKAERKAHKTEGLITPRLQDMNFERKLRRVATRGVVVLFNAIQTHQNTIEENGFKKAKAKANAEVKKASKESFLDMLTQGSKEKEASASKPWSVLRDDFGMEAKNLTDFDKENLDDEESEIEQEVEQSEEEEEEDE
mmetsp:Transcript_5937/g.11101  ORF Transcript_5937/g.11101 Transcript_5937/m.11101 type:complete len:245 (+) Transcript_5937:234-968(+)